MFSKSLKELPKGAIAEIVSIQDESLASRLASFGLHQGTKITVINKTIRGGTIYVKTERRRMALRATEASTILVR